MRILVIGGDGMLGHRLLADLLATHETRVTLRRPVAEYAARGLFSDANAYGGIDVRDEAALRRAVGVFRPDAVVNAAGVIKQRGDSADAIGCIEVNALFPHRLARLCAEHEAYLVHYSTDCVFSGRSGRYSEKDFPDPVDLYGRSKLLGEPEAANCITLRTSMVGFELGRSTGLLEWFLSQKGRVQGYRRAVFSGLTTIEHARIVKIILAQQQRKTGLYHVAADPISKFDFLCMVKRHLKLATDIASDDSVVIDRSLDASRFRQDFGYSPPTWDHMVGELATTGREARR